MTNSSDRKVAFITGANRGIGFETARQLGIAGIFPVLGARSADAGREAVATLAKDGIEAHWLLFDATRAEDHERAYHYFADSLGRLDILINNAGIYLEGEIGTKDLYTPLDIPSGVLRETMEANFFAPVALTQKLLPLIAKAGAGRIVNVSSILGSLTLHADPESPIYSLGAVAYDTSKTALNAYTVHLAKALRGSRIKVNAAHPGWVQTAMGGSAAPMNVADGAKTSVALATLGDEGPSGGFFHLGEPLPW